MTSERRTGTKGVARADRERQILDLAGQAFAAQGFLAVSVADIARAAGISKPMIYHYFGSKEGLFERCVRESCHLLVAEIERSSLAGAVGLERALLTLDGVFVVLADRPWAWSVATEPTPVAPAVDGLRQVFGQRLEGMARAGVAELLSLAGDDDEQDVAAMTAVWSSVFDALVTWWVAHPDVTPAQMSARCARLFGAVFGPVSVGGPH